MKSLANPQDKAKLLARLEKLGPQSQGQWGKMTAQQMLCHLTDSFKISTGQIKTRSRVNLYNKTIMKWGALYSNYPWPHGIKTAPEADQQIAGTPPTEFARDKQELQRILEIFCTNAPQAAHPLFDHMSHKDWLIWGYKHMDYHLRQFAV